MATSDAADAPVRSSSFVGPITFAVLIVLGWLANASIRPPIPLSENAAATEFSAARAMRDVREIAKKPHPLGSAENARVRDYLVARLRELGANARVETSTVTRHDSRDPDIWAVVNNVVARIPGSAPTGALMLVAHYDSVPSGPGAGDDASGVAAILEAVRAIKAGGSPLHNDLIVLFTDGEELGLLGAQAFVEEPGTRADFAETKVVLNFDMRGDEGPSMMFQTGVANSWLIDQLGAAPYPYATSSIEAADKSFGSDTDLTVFLSSTAGMNFGVFGGITRYHNRLDNADLLDLGSLQHQGTYALSMAQRFGSIDLNGQRDADSVFFTIGGRLFSYSTRLALPLAILVTILLAVAISLRVRDGRVTIGGIGVGVAVYAIACVVAVEETHQVLRLIAYLAGWRMLPVLTTYGGAYFAAAASALIVATLLSGYVIVGRWVDLQNLGAGALAALALVMLAGAARPPAGSSYLLTWPILFASLALFYRDRPSDLSDKRRAVVALIALAPGTLIFGPLLVGADATPNLMLLSSIAPAVLFGLYVPYLDFLNASCRWIAPATLGLLAIALIVKGNSASNFDASHPHPDSIFYFLDADRSNARWISLDSRPDRFTSQFFQHHVRGGWLTQVMGNGAQGTSSAGRGSRNRGRTIEGDAPLIAPLPPPPEMKVLDDTTENGVRAVKMHIASARGAPIVSMAVPTGVKVVGSWIDDHAPDDRTSDGWAGWYWQAPRVGFDLTLELATPRPFTLTVIDQTDGLPALADFTIKPRPPDTMPRPFQFLDSATLVRKTFRIGGEQISTR